MLLKAQKRELLGKRVRSFRKVHQIPGAAYTKGKETVNLLLSEKELLAVFKKIGYSSIFDLEIEGSEAQKALFKDVQIDYLRGKVLHASMYLVDMASKITTTVPVRITGLSMAVKNNLGLLVTPLSDVTVYCLPGNLPQELVVDIGKLDNVGDQIFLRDLALPEGVEVASSQSKDSILAAIVTPQKAIEDEEVKATDATAEAGAEGEAAEGADAAKGADAKGAEAAKPAKGGAKK